MIQAKIILDSINTVTGDRITTWELIYPRFIHSELMTHRMFSKNAASSRAIPIKQMILAVLRNPAEPVWWGRNQSGMQAKQELSGLRLWFVRRLWFMSRYFAIAFAWLMWKLDLHKQIANRILEPWMHMTIVMTGTEHENFFKLRAHPDAQPEFQALAFKMKEEYEKSVPRKLDPGDWHLPLVDEPGTCWLADIENAKKVCVARCARVSYTKHDSKKQLEDDLALHDRLAQSGHWSPFEHAAQALSMSEYFGNFRGWLQYRKEFKEESGRSR